MLIIVLLIINTALRLSTTDPLSMILWATMLFSIFYFSTQIRLKKISLGILASVFYFSFHSILADTSILLIGLFLVVIVFYLELSYVKINTKTIGYFFFLLMIIDLIVGIPQILQVRFGNINSAFAGFFQNGNTNGNFGCCCFCACFLFLKNKKLKKIVFLVSIIYIVGSLSRNTLLFFIVSLTLKYLLDSQKFKKFVVPGFVLLACFCMFYLIVLEPTMQATDIEVLGKKSTSAGRSQQILMTINQFPITFFGVGSDIPSNFAISRAKYAIHNMYVDSFYGMGILYMIGYLFFIGWLYRNLKSNMAKSCLLAFSLYFMFEPGKAFSSSLINFLPILIILLQLSHEREQILKIKRLRR